MERAGFLSEHEMGLLNDAIKCSIEWVKYVLGESPKTIHIEWSSEKKTSAAGTAWWTTGRIVMSTPLWRRVRERDGYESFQDAFLETLVHEICHIYTPRDHHGAQWRKAMVACGYEPNTHCAITDGFDRELTPDEVRRTFPIGATVSFEARGEEYIGTVIRHNRDTFSVDVGGGRWWRLDYRKEDVWLS